MVLPAENPTDTPASTPTETQPVVPEIPMMNLEVLLDYDAHRAEVAETIIYPNQTGIPLTYLVLAIESNFWPGAFNLVSASMDGIPVTPILEEQYMEIQLPQVLQPESVVTLQFQYTLDIPVLKDPGLGELNLTTFGYSDRQLNLSHWYPFVVPYIPEKGWLLNDPWISGEYLVHPIADYTVHLRFSDPANPPIVAASGSEQPSPQTGPASNFHHYILARGRAFAISASYEYLVSEQDAGGVLVKSYYFPEHQTGGQAVLQASVDAILTFSEKFGPPPHPTLSAVEADFDDGMEFSGLYFLGGEYYARYDGTAMNYATLLAAHETGHQWWFERVANDQAKEPWLDEALTTYSELVFLEAVYPELVSWWWPFRVDEFEPKGWVDTSIYGGGKFRPYVNAVYLRGAHFIHDLRVRMGDEPFFAFMRDYLAQMNGGIATKENFLTILRQHTSADVSDIIAEYFQDPR
jgi:Peptidase family M1 domain